MTTILGTLILFSISPLGFMILMSLLLFFEYVIIKSIIKDINVVHIKKFISYIKNYKPKFISLEKISDTVGITIH